VLTLAPGELNADSEFVELVCAVAGDDALMVYVELGVRSSVAVYSAQYLVKEGFASWPASS